jgi:uncharacterized membrane protein
MAIDFAKTFERTPEAMEPLTWALYIGSCALAALTLGEISGTLLFFGAFAVVILASTRKDIAANTVHSSHLQNISSVMKVNLVAAALLMAFTWATLGIGIILTWPIYLCVLLWTGYKLIRGLIKLNDGLAY